ncbi:MAG: hypothetical protein ACK5M0_02580 [Bacteroidales bacterium]
MVEDLKQKIISGEATENDIFEAEKLISQEDYHRYLAEVENRKKNSIVGILLAVFLAAYGAPLFYYGLDAKNAKIIGILLIVGWLTIYIGIGAFVVLAAEIWSIIMTVTTWSKDSELKTKKEVILNYL